MIVAFTFAGEEVFIRADSIVAVMPDQLNKGKAVVYVEDPVGLLSIEESADTAFCAWSSALEESHNEPTEECS